nr:MAG: ORF1 [Torque teno midi virus]
MPFWWARRNKLWRGRWRSRYRKRRPYKTRRRRRRPFYKNRRRRSTRRRRKRRRKVRRKNKTVNVKQWNPDRIVKCKIKGYDTVVLGADGKQFVCYTDDRDDWVPARAPGGGGFGVEVYTLSYLYSQYQLKNNIWTKSNALTDLVRFTGVKIKFFRHQYIDFVARYSRMPPFKLTVDTYMNAHPLSLLLSKHRVIIPSRKTRPLGRPYVTLHIKPPKLMLTSWYFQESFANEKLFQLDAAACDLRYPHMACCNTNQLISLLTIDIQFYTQGNWGNAQPTTTRNYYNPTGNLNPTVKITNSKGQEQTITVKQNTYAESVSYTDGWFQPPLLAALKVNSQNVQPIGALRYNPMLDDGRNNSVWFSSVLTASYDRPRTDKNLIIEGIPLWKALFGFANFVQKIKGEKNFLKSYVVLVSSPYIFPFKNIGTQNYHMPIDKSFVDGKGPYNDYLTSDKKTKWFPTLEHQQESINAFVKCGPFIPRLESQKDSTWELYIKYYFYFKWGGGPLPDEKAADPSQQVTYEPSSAIRQATQIINPEKQKISKMLHSWDYRRGIITKTALKRIYEDGETDTDFQPDADSRHMLPPAPKKTKNLQAQEEEDKEVQACLLSLCEENTYQEEESPNLYNLIQQQQQQQNLLKHNLLQLISNLKAKQRMLQLQTGLLD